MRLLSVCCALVVALGVVSFGSAAEPEEEVIGKWVTTDGKGPPMEVIKGGKFKFGWTREKDGWKMAEGTFQVKKDGNIDAYAGLDGVNLTMYFKLEKGEIKGKVGEKDVTWKKEEPK